MAVRIDQLIEYLDSHPICYYADNVESLLGMLYDIYTKHNGINSNELRKLTQKLDVVLEKLPVDTRDGADRLVGEMCREHEQVAFVHGVVVGLCLMTEIRTVT